MSTWLFFVPGTFKIFEIPYLSRKRGQSQKRFPTVFRWAKSPSEAGGIDSPPLKSSPRSHENSSSSSLVGAHTPTPPCPPGKMIRTYLMCFKSTEWMQSSSTQHRVNNCQNYIHSFSPLNILLFLDHPAFLPLGPTILCTPLLCCWRFFSRPKLLPHMVQLNCFSPLCDLSWSVKFVLCMNLLAQMLHWNLGSWWINSCLLTSPLDPYLFPQNLQL